MSRKLFTEEQQQLLRNNPYVYSVTASRLQLTKEFKELFMTAYNSGDSPRTILENYGFNIGIIGERRIWWSAFLIFLSTQPSAKSFYPLNLRHFHSVNSPSDFGG